MVFRVIPSFGFIIDVLIIIVSFIIIYKLRNKIAKAFKLIPLPVYVVAIISSIPFMLIEESINCMDWGNGCGVTWWIIYVLIAEIAILCYLTKRFKCTSIKKPLIWFMVLGTLWEILIGGLAGQLFVLPWFFSVFMVFIYVPLSYAYISVIPLVLIVRYKK